MARTQGTEPLADAIGLLKESHRLLQEMRTFESPHVLRILTGEARRLGQKIDDHLRAAEPPATMTGGCPKCECWRYGMFHRAECEALHSGCL